MKIIHILTAATLLCAVACNRPNPNLERAEQMRATLYTLYDVDETPLLAENHPIDPAARATYLAEGADNQVNRYSYLWPYSGTLSMLSALYEATGSEEHLKFIDSDVIAGLDQYFDTTREPNAYSSYITVGESDRFYDDNIWLVIDFVDLYHSSGEERYLERAEQTWRFVESGRDDVLGDGIYWCEQKRHSKNACSNAPASVAALKLYKATKNEAYLTAGKELYAWCYATLHDEEDDLFFDNMSLTGRISRAKYSYNSGQMIEAGAMLYDLTGEERYLKQAQATAAGCYERWFKPMKDGEQEFRMMESGDVWFDAVMLRGLIALYEQDENDKYLQAVNRSLDYAWRMGRDEHGLFGKFLSHRREEDKRSWLLTQAAYAEMSARMAKVNLR